MHRRRLLATCALSAFALLGAPADAAESGFLDPEVTVGRADAPKSLTIYISTTCTHCAAFAREVLPRVEHDLVDTGRVRLIIRELPTAPVAVSSAGFLLARCSGRENYWRSVGALLAKQEEILSAQSLEDALARQAAVVGLDRPAMSACLSDTIAIDALNDRRQAGLDLAVEGTPTFLIDGITLVAGRQLAGKVYAGGEISYAQLLDALQPPKQKRAGRISPSRPRSRSK